MFRPFPKTRNISTCSIKWVHAVYYRRKQTAVTGLYGHQTFVDVCRKIRNLEHQCDEICLIPLSPSSNHSFITPIDREDIYGLASSLDDVMDLIETISAHIVLFRIEHATEWSRHMVGLLHKISLELIVAIKKSRCRGFRLDQFY